jgi:thioredoxin 1
MSITRPDPRSCWVICLCADWCGVCRGYHQIFETAAARRPDLRFAWIDIEEQSDLLGGMDIETFPTLYVLDGSGVRFQGTVMPNLATTSRLIDSFCMQGSRDFAHDGFSTRLLGALPALPESWVGP